MEVENRWKKLEHSIKGEEYGNETTQAITIRSSVDALYMYG